MKLQTGTGKLQTGKLALPQAPAKAAHEDKPKAAPAKHKEPTAAERSKSLARLREAVDARDDALPWRNDADMNAKLEKAIVAKVKAKNIRWGKDAQALIRAEIAKYKGKLSSSTDFSWHVTAPGVIKVSLRLKGKMDAFDSSGVTLRQSVDSYIKKGGDPDLAYHVLKQLDKPNARIKQINKFTCVPANVQRDIAKMNPQKYFVLATSLALKGRAELPNGKMLQVSAENRKWIETSDMPPNKRINAYFQSALMDMADGKAKYDAKAGKSTAENGLSMAALGIEQARSLWKNVSGTPAFDPVAYMSLMKKQNKPANAKTMLHEVERLFAAAKGQQRVMVPIKSEANTKNMFHQVTVLKMSKDQIRYFDPAKAGEVTMSRAEFLDKIASNMKPGDRIGEMGSTMLTSGTAAPAPSTGRRR